MNFLSLFVLIPLLMTCAMFLTKDIRRIRAQEQRVRGQQVLMEMEDEDNDAGVGDVHPQAGEAE